MNISFSFFSFFDSTFHSIFKNSTCYERCDIIIHNSFFINFITKTYDNVLPFNIKLKNCRNCFPYICYCEILFIRGDPIFVVFVDGLAHEFKIPRIMNTITNIIVTIIFKLLPILGCTSIDICLNKYL